MYNWQLPEWPHFSYDPQQNEEKLLLFLEQLGHINGLMQAITPKQQQEALTILLSNETFTTAAIEGEFYSREDIYSSIINNLGISNKQRPVKNKNAKKIAQLVVEARNSYAQPLSEAMLLYWHSILFENNTKINAGKWRVQKAPMQVVTGTIGKEKIYYEAPPAMAVPKEIKHFIHWFNETAPGGKLAIKKAPIRAAIAHLYFESIHPFEDGNGRIGRVIAEKALSQTVGFPMLISLSSSIEKNKKIYYNRLSESQKTMQIDKWVSYFFDITLSAQKQTRETIEFILKKTAFFSKHKHALNTQQLKVITKMLDAEPDGFTGGMSAKKYMSITKVSKATATRHLQHLTALGVLAIYGEGRNTHYKIIL